jgi:hypothetical protein
MLRAAFFTLALMAFALAAVGCGKTSGSGAATQTKSSASATSTATPASQTTPTAHVQTTAGAPLTHAQWIAKGDAVCAKLIAQLNLMKVKSVSEIPRLIPQELVYMHAEIAALSKLTPPADKTSDWQQLLNLKQAWAEGIAQLSTNPQFARTLSTSPVFRAAAATRLRADKIAKRDGFNHCSRT